MNANYARAFGYLESAVHRALRELETQEAAGYVLVPRMPTAGMLDAAYYDAHGEDAAGVWASMIAAAGRQGLDEDPKTILRRALNDLRDNHGIELHWPDDVKEINHAR